MIPRLGLSLITMVFCDVVWSTMLGKGGSCAYRKLPLILQGLLPGEYNDVTRLMRGLPHRGRAPGMLLIQRLVGRDDVLIRHGSTKPRSGVKRILRFAHYAMSDQPRSVYI